MVRSLSLTLSLLLAAPALPCPLCDNESAKEIRAGLADEHLGISIVAIVAPFAAVLGVVGLVHFGLPGSRRQR